MNKTLKSRLPPGASSTVEEQRILQQKRNPISNNLWGWGNSEAEKNTARDEKSLVQTEERK